MAAYTELPDGRLIRWHDNYTECDQPTCDRYHVTKTELFATEPDDGKGEAGAAVIHADVARAAHQMSVWWRARVLCTTAEPHGASRPPCEKHEEEARRQLRFQAAQDDELLGELRAMAARIDPPPVVRARPGSALSSVAEGRPPSLGAGDSGASERVPGPPPGQHGGSTLQTDNRSEVGSPGAACRPNVLGQKQVTP